MLNSSEHEICPANKSKLFTIVNFFLLNTCKAEHEIFTTNKYENANNSCIVCLIWAYRRFQQSFSHIATVSGCGRELNAHF